MKKVIVCVSAAILIALPSFVFAGYHEVGGGNVMLQTRLEASKDNSNWVNYSAELNSGGQTLTVSPGDSVYLRLKTWDTGQTAAMNIEYSGTFTNPQYLGSTAMFTSGGGGQDDLDADATFYYGSTSYDLTTGAATFSLDAVQGLSTVDSNYQSGGITAQINSSSPDQTVILVTVQITSAQIYVTWWEKLLFPRAHADDQGTTQVRMIVSNPPATTPATEAQTLPVTGPDPIQLIMAPVIRLCR